jgi:hypothetical protein
LQLRGASVTANFFSTLEVSPRFGHDFEPGDDQDGRPRKIILSHNLWLSRFGADPQVIGRHAKFNSLSYAVVGIAPPQLRFPERDLDFWTPSAIDDGTRKSRGNFWMEVAGRLREGVSLQRAQSEMDAYSRSLAEQHPGDRNMAAAGLGLGAFGAFSLSSLLNSMLFGVRRFDAASYLAAAAALLVICFFAAISPALRATRTDPLIAMRSE